MKGSGWGHEYESMENRKTREAETGRFESSRAAVWARPDSAGTQEADRMAMFCRARGPGGDSPPERLLRRRAQLCEAARPVPGAYKEMEGWKKAEPKDHLLRGMWWTLFNDPQLTALEEKVSISNQNIAQAEAQFRQAKALVQVARSAYFPTAAIGPSFQRGFQTSPQQGTQTLSLWSLPVDVSWGPDLFGRVRRNVESSRASAQATAADLENVRLTMCAEVAQDYFQLRALDAQKQLLEANGEGLQQILANDTKQVHIGRFIEGRRAPGRNPAQNHPGPGDQCGGAARAARGRYRDARGKARV